MAKAYFAAGCFWGVEAAFRKVEGVTATAVGYMGGHKDHPTYEAVCGGDTGHAEAVEVEFDPSQVGYDQLLETFWNCHDPTQVNRQGPDIGSQYRTAIFTTGEEQATAARTSLERRRPLHTGPIATEITAAPTFWMAEDYHQQYFEKRWQKMFRLG